MSDEGSVAAALTFVDRLRAGELASLQIEVDEAVVDGCVVVLFGVARPAGQGGLSPVACRVRVEDDVVTDWCLYGAGDLRPVAASA
jgi:hypothetical protein